ncbi:MAG: undecaprenyl-diphosphate phosphatase [Chitinophagaceae bacterium]|jgi:undecaprenyl-diphosphatase|nr:undecaprenyl-diphosphate phosphatase [Chitinophagaceae bacterium]
MTIFQAIILAIVEGLTEFLPVSSTGHMIVASSLMGIHQQEFTKLFEVAVQFGTILSVVVLYWKKFFDFSRLDFYLKLIVAVVPALALGFLLGDYIDALLESPTTVAVMLIIGGVFFLFIDKVFKAPRIHHEPEIAFKNGFVVGFWQCLAMVPGVSRSAASIIGGLQQGFSRKLAAEFSFFLAVPTMAAATGYKLLKAWLENPDMLRNTDNLKALAIGNLVGFLVAIAAIKFFIGFVQKFGFRYFGWYRIVAGIVILILLYTGVMHK